MQEVLFTLIAQFKEFFNKLSPVKRASVIASSVISVLIIFISFYMVSEDNYSTLFKDLTNENLPTIVEKLKNKNVKFIIADDGKTIKVPTELLNTTLMLVASELNGEDIGSIGLELFDKQDFGVTSYAQKINYQRAIQGELIRAINTLSAVKQSKVLLALPPKKTFLEESGISKASVIIDLYPGKTINPKQVKGIVQLVASAVENLSTDNVTVVDNKGRVLSKTTSGNSAASGELDDLKSKIENKLSIRIEDMLTRVIGQGKVIARVNVNLNSKEVRTLEEKVFADATALQSSTSEEELLDGSRTNPTGIPGARANLPGAGDKGQVGFKQNVRKELKQNKYLVPKTVKNIKQAAGGIEKISVAVLVDGVVSQIKDKDGNPTDQWVPRTPEEMVKYKSIITNAIGINLKRGDSITVENIRFQQEDFTESEKVLTRFEQKKLLHSLIKWSLLGFALALFFFLVVRPFIGWVTDAFVYSVDDVLPRTIEELEELQSSDNILPGMSDILPVIEDSMDPGKAECELIKERIIKIVNEDTDKARGAFSLWLSRKEM